MSGAPEFAAPLIVRRSGNRLLAALEAALAAVNRIIMALSAMALLAAACVLIESVIVRYLFKATTDWQDEVTVFLLVGATFLSSAFVQSQRGHVGIEALAGLLPVWADHARRLLIDAASLLFCGFFAWKSWTLTYEAWSDGATTASVFAPPLSIPYGLMAAGMTLLALQIALQLAAGLAAGPDANADHFRAAAPARPALPAKSTLPAKS